MNLKHQLINKKYSLVLYILPLIFVSTKLYSQDISSTYKDIDTVKSIIVQKLEPSNKKYIQYIENLDGTVHLNSILTRNIQRTRYNNQDALLMTQTYQTKKGIDIDSSIVNSKTLMPYAYFTNIKSGAYQEKVIFSNNKIINKVIANDSVDIKKIPNNNYYNGVIINDIISELPLALNKKFVVNCINVGKTVYEYTTTISVEGVDFINVNSLEAIECWRLNVTNIINGKEMINNQWYSKNDHVQIKLIFELSNGSQFIRNLIIG